MAYDEDLANRVRERLANLPVIEEKEMMGGLTFMVNDKMCIGIIKDEMMCRIDPEFHGTARTLAFPHYLEHHDIFILVSLKSSGEYMGKMQK